MDASVYVYCFSEGGINLPRKGIDTMTVYTKDLGENSTLKINANPNGTFSVVVFDEDAGETAGFAFIYKTLAAAIAYAEKSFKISLSL